MLVADGDVLEKGGTLPLHRQFLRGDNLGVGGLLLTTGTLENLTAWAVLGLGAQLSTFSRDPTREANPLGQRKTKPTLQLQGWQQDHQGFPKRSARPRAVVQQARDPIHSLAAEKSREQMPSWAGDMDKRPRGHHGVVAGNH